MVRVFHDQKVAGTNPKTVKAANELLVSQPSVVDVHSRCLLLLHGQIKCRGHIQLWCIMCCAVDFYHVCISLPTALLYFLDQLTATSKYITVIEQSGQTITLTIYS